MNYQWKPENFPIRQNLSVVYNPANNVIVDLDVHDFHLNQQYHICGRIDRQTWIYIYHRYR